MSNLNEVYKEIILNENCEETILDEAKIKFPKHGEELSIGARRVKFWGYRKYDPNMMTFEIINGPDKGQSWSLSKEKFIEKMKELDEQNLFNNNDGVMNETILDEQDLFENTITNPNLSIVLPGGCNGKCNFCFWKKSTGCSNYIQKLGNVLESLPSQFYQLSLTGGEPTMSPYLNEVLNLIDKDTFPHSVLTTNGYKISEFVSKLEGKIDHVNISRHHYSDKINDSIFGSKMISESELKNVANELNKVGIDVTFSAVLNENLNTKEDIEKYIKFAKECGASQVFFRKPHGTLDPSNVEKMYENYKSNEYHCPVCRTKNQLIEGMKVSWKASLEEPSKVMEMGTIYELIINENAEVTKDWEGKLKVNYNRINENYNGINEDVKKKRFKKRKKLKKDVGGFVDSCSTEDWRGSCGGSGGGGGSCGGPSTGGC